MKKKRALLWIASVALCAGAFFFVFGRQGVYFLHREVHRKQREIDEKARTIDSLKRELERLKNDTAHIERIAREKLGMARPGEKVFKFIEKRK
jgi:cell division protein FtsL